ncbi:hypothetical protein [Bacillus wiedmannii]|uniref:hypothetical protein n=1 Tax=Bacillus wiedmannii TaxID=1890302 RepID=UPI000BF5DD1F|nr:hypothetical protein [Bacillus wiedmannii]MED3316708.1 hypothetical protein [Bacillus wiedmannii]PGB61804.1 hypothetical protein COM12_24295 [Bacillus wiedmannii]
MDQKTLNFILVTLLCGAVWFFLEADISNAGSTEIIIVFVFLLIIFVAVFKSEKIKDFTETALSLLNFREKVNKHKDEYDININNNRNFCTAFLTSKDGSIKKYYSISGKSENLIRGDKEELSKLIDGYICLESDLKKNNGGEIYPIEERLDHSLNWVKFESIPQQKYAMARNNCTERKIIRYIIKQFENEQHVLGDTVLEMTTENEPCLYCLKLLQDVKRDNIFKEINVYYKDMYLEYEMQNISASNQKFYILKEKINDLISQEKEKKEKKNKKEKNKK